MFRNPFADGLIILVILLLFLAPKRLPMLGRGVGEGIKEFKDGISNSSDSDEQPQITEKSGEKSDAGAQSGQNADAKSGAEQ